MNDTLTYPDVTKLGKMKNGKTISQYFGQNTFHVERMKQMLPPDVFQRVANAIHGGKRLDVETAHVVANAMKDWAVSNGCTHYTHWFQPMTGFTAEKHDSFIEHAGDGQVMESFSGKQLIQGEPDASSFPSGGLRATFEARGYTIWDPTSPAFILEYPHGNTLCIPSIFISFTGDTLDKKAPLLRSVEALNKAALGVLGFFNNQATRVFSTLGVEQEYFLIDRSYFRSRPDLIQTGRTLFGNTPAKHQQLEDQYFGNIPERAFAFMTEVEEEAYKLGIPLKTRHNEVAPNQFEAAPIFEDVNVAIDHNQILMDLMDRIGKRHDLAVLFHEKPFASINGSGKHCNWSLGTDTGENLLNPGKTPQSNLQFLLFLISTIKAVHDHSRILRAAIASAANDNRLGANEAPPAIISVFLGDLMTKVLKDLEAGRVTPDTDQAWLSIGIDKIPQVPKDNTDRNRTSPFAFTGNKFEFRAVGSSDTPATAITVLNTALAEKLSEAKTVIEAHLAEGKEMNAAILETIRKMARSSRKILFEGDNYSQEWVDEAGRRGLPNFKTTPEAAPAIVSKPSIKLFTQFGVYSHRELEAWYHIDMENYMKQIDIEAKVTMDISQTMIIPSCVRYLNDLLETARGLKDLLGGHDKGVKGFKELIRDISTRTLLLRNELAKLQKELYRAEAMEDLTEKGLAFASVKNQREKIRLLVDALEERIADEYWPVPKYREMLFAL